MVMQLSAQMETNLVTARTLNKIRRTINEKTGEYIVDKVVRHKFSQSLPYEIPGVYKPRTKRYVGWKRKKVGHNIPWVLTGNSKKYIPANAKITRTANGGKVMLRVSWAGKAIAKGGGNFAKQGMHEFQRQELEAMSPRQRDRMAKFQEREFVKEINDPKNLRKRKVRG